MLRCRKMRSLMAAAAYGDLAADEREALDRHMAACPSCRAEAESLARTVAIIPASRPELGVDLVRAVRRRLAEDEAPRPVLPWKWVSAAVAAALVAVVGFALYRAQMPAPVPTVPVAASPVAQAIEEARGLLAQGNYTGGYDALSRAVAEHGSDPEAGKAQLLLAETAFERHWYDKAHSAYRDLMAKYNDTVQADAGRDRIVRTWNLLDEGRETKYAQLYGLDQARRNPAGAFDIYENVVAQNPNTDAAYEAMRGMVALVGKDIASDRPETVVATMESVRDKCKNPIAVAKLNYEIGNRAWHDLNDLDLARESFQKAARTSDPVLAQRAQESLEQVSEKRENPS